MNENTGRQLRPRMSAEQIAQILGAGPDEAIEAVAKRVGCGAETIRRYRKAASLEPLICAAALADKRAYEDRIAYIRAHYGQRSTEDLAAHLGITRNAVTQIAKRFRIKFQGARNQFRHDAWTPERNARFKQLHGQGVPAREIAKALACTEKVVHRRVAVLGLSRARLAPRSPEEIADEYPPGLTEVPAHMLPAGITGARVHRMGW